MTTNIIKRKNGNSNLPATFTGWFDQVFQDNLDRFIKDESWGFNGLNQANNVPVNVRETDKTFEMELIIPGIRKEDLKLHVSEGMLTISFESQEEKTQENNRWLRHEHSAHSFSRNFNLDDSIDVNKISAKYENGVLYLTLPKKENAQRVSKTIEIG